MAVKGALTKQNAMKGAVRLKSVWRQKDMDCRERNEREQGDWLEERK